MEISRDGSRSTSARTVSLTDAVQAMTAAATQRGGTPAAPVTNLPRDPLDLSPFGPLAPLLIQAINPPREDTGRPEPRAWDYPAGFNLPGGGERLISWETLRATSTNVDIIRRCIEIRKDDVRALKMSWQVSEDAIKAAMEDGGNRAREDVESELRKRFAPDIARLTTFWRVPWVTNGVRFGQWIARILEDHIVCDGVAIYPVTTVGGQVIAFRVVDATTVKLLINADGERPQPPYPAFQQEVQGFPRGEFVADVVLNEDGTEDLSGTWTASQLTYWRENLRPDSPYGYSQVEQSLVSAALYLKRQGWMHAEYDSGSTPMTWLVPQGDKFVASQLGPQQRREYELAINDDLEGQTGARHRVKISYPGFEPKQMDTEAERYKPEYDRFLVNMVIGHMGVTMDRFGLTETKGLGATGQHERQAEVQDDSGVNPDAEMLQDIVMELSRNYLDAPAELCFVLTKDKAKDDAAEDAVADVQIKRGSLTLNEDRRRIGRPTFDFPEADMPAFYGASGPVYIEGGLERAQAAQDQAAALADAKANPPAPGGGPGGPGGSGASGPAKPTSKPSAAPTRNKAAIAGEVRAFGRWIDKTAHPARPFRFEYADPADVWEAGWTLDPGVMAFEGFTWVADPIEKSRRPGGVDWRGWNAMHPLHPRGPHGRFVRAAGLVDELKRIHGDLGEMHENALDEAARRAHAGRHLKRGDSQLADELERRGFLEEYGGKGGNGNKLEVSEAGRRHLQSRGDHEAPAVAPKIPHQRTPSEPKAPKAPYDQAAADAASKAYGDGDWQWREAAGQLAAHGVAKRGNAAEMAQSKDARAELVGEILDDIAPKADREAMAPKVDRAVEAAARHLAPEAPKADARGFLHDQPNPGYPHYDQIKVGDRVNVRDFTDVGGARQTGVVEDKAHNPRTSSAYVDVRLDNGEKVSVHPEDVTPAAPEAEHVPEAPTEPKAPARSEIAELQRAAEAADLEAHRAKVKREAVDRRPAITRAEFNRKVKDARALDEEALKHRAKARKHREAADKLRAQGATPEDRATISELGDMAHAARAEGRHEDAARAFEARAARLRNGESGWRLNPPSSKGESVLVGESGSGASQGFPSRKQAEQWRAEADATTAGIAEHEAAQQRKLAAKAKAPTSDGLPNDSSGTIGSMTTPEAAPAAKAPKRLPDAQHNALMTIAAKRAEHAQREDAHRTPMPNDHKIGLTRNATLDAMARAGYIERRSIGIGYSSVLTDKGHAYLAEHTGDTERAALVRELADVRAQRAALAADSASRPVNDDYGRYDTHAARLRHLNNEQDKPLYGREHQILRDLERKPVMTEEDRRITEATAKADAAHEEWQAAQDRFNAATDAAYEADGEDPQLNAAADKALTEEKAARDRYHAAEDELHRAGEPKRRREQDAADAEWKATLERQAAERQAKAKAEADAKKQAEANRARRAAEDEARQAAINAKVREMTPQVYATLLAGSPNPHRLTHEPSRKILAQMREQGWVGVSQQGSVSVWEAPDGRRMGIYRDTAKGGLAFQDERGHILAQKDAAELVHGSEHAAPSGPGYDAHAVSQLLDAATSREDAAKALDDMNLTAPQLRALAGDLGVTVRASDSKQRIRDTITGIKVQRRLDSRAIHPDRTPRAVEAPEEMRRMVGATVMYHPNGQEQAVQGTIEATERVGSLGHHQFRIARHDDEGSVDRVPLGDVGRTIEAPSAKQLHPATPEGVRAAYADVLAEQGTAPSDTSWVSIADLRDRMGGSRGEQDAALREIEQHRDVNIVPQANQKVTSERTRAAAVRIGGQDKTHLVIDPNSEAEAARDEARLREIEAREAAQARSAVEAPAAEPAPRIVPTPDAAPEPTGHGASSTPDAVAEGRIDMTPGADQFGQIKRAPSREAAMQLMGHRGASETRKPETIDSDMQAAGRVWDDRVASSESRELKQARYDAASARAAARTEGNPAKRAQLERSAERHQARADELEAAEHAAIAENLGNVTPNGEPKAPEAPKPEPRKIPSRSGPAKRGDVMVVEKQGEYASYTSSDAERERKTYPVYEVTSVSQDGAPKMLREITRGEPGDKGEQVRMAMLHSTGKTQIIPGEAIDKKALTAALRTHHYPGHPDSPRDHESLAELRDAVRGALHPEGYKPAKVKAPERAAMDTTRVHLPEGLTDEQRAKLGPQAEKIDEANAKILAHPYEGPAVRGDAAVQQVKAARELVAQARDAGMTVAVLHRRAHGEPGHEAPYFEIQAINPHTGEGFTATWHTWKGKNGSYGFMHGSIVGGGRGRRDAGPRAISDFMARAGERQAARDAEHAAKVEAERIANDPRTPKQVSASEVQEGDWRWNPVTGWERIGMIGERRDSGRDLYAEDRETRLGTIYTRGLGASDKHWIVRHGDRPTAPPPGERAAPNAPRIVETPHPAPEPTGHGAPRTAEDFRAAVAARQAERNATALAQHADTVARVGNLHPQTEEEIRALADRMGLKVFNVYPDGEGGWSAAFAHKGHSNGARIATYDSRKGWSISRYSPLGSKPDDDQVAALLEEGARSQDVSKADEAVRARIEDLKRARGITKAAGSGQGKA